MSFVNDKIQITLEWAKEHYFTCSLTGAPAFIAELIRDDYLPGLYRLTSIPEKERGNIIKAIMHFGNNAVPLDWPTRQDYLRLVESFAQVLQNSENLQHEFTLESAKGAVQALLRIEAGDIESHDIRPLQSETCSQFELAMRLINYLDLSDKSVDQIMAYSLFANFADHASFSEGEQVRDKLQNLQALSSWFFEKWQLFQKFLQRHPLLMAYWNDLITRWQNAHSLTYVPDNAFEWAFDLFLINQKVVSNLQSRKSDWEINIVPRRFAIGDDIDAILVKETFDSPIVSDDCRNALGINIFILPVSSIQGLNWMEVDKNLIDTVKRQDLIVLKGYGNFLCAAPYRLQLDCFHLFVPKGLAGRRITGNIEEWNHTDICPPLILHLTGEYRIASQYPSIEYTISDIISGKSIHS